jgi:transcriptional regulator with XRE-family HTH domain
MGGPERTAERIAADHQLMDGGHGGVGGRIKAARQSAGMTQAVLASSIGVSRSAVAQWETDRSGQVGANLARVAAALGVSAQHLLTGADGPEGGRSAESGDELALLRLYRALGEADRQVLLRLAVRLSRGGRGSDD